MRRIFRGRQDRNRGCPTCGESCFLYSWSEADVDPGSGRRSVRTYVYVHPSTGGIDKLTPTPHNAPEADGPQVSR